MELGDKVYIKDYSYIINLDRYVKGEIFKEHNDSSNYYKIVEFKYNNLQGIGTKTEVHDVIIKNIETGKHYLHSLALIELISEQKVIEKTMADIELLYGCKVKIIN